MPATQETSNVVSIRAVNFNKTICIRHPAREHKVPSLTTDDVDCQSAHASTLLSVGLSTAGMGNRGLTTAHLRGGDPDPIVQSSSPLWYPHTKVTY